MPPPLIKVAVVGPVASGKSSFINFATEQRESLGEGYVPTIPVRIIEYDSPLKIKGKTVTPNIQIYDCSGDLKFENTWPAMSHKLHGTVFVYDPDEKKQAEELNLWYNNFVEKANIHEKCRLLVASRKSRDDDDEGKRHSGAGEAKLSSLFADMPRIAFNGKNEELEGMKQTFAEFLKRVVSETLRGQEQDERFM